MNQEEPLEGYSEFATNSIVPAYYAQNQADALDLEMTVLETVMQAVHQGRRCCECCESCILISFVCMTAYFRTWVILFVCFFISFPYHSLLLYYFPPSQRSLGTV